MWVAGVFAQAGGYVGPSGQAQGADGEVAQGGQGAWEVAGGCAARVFSQRDVADVVDLILHGPVGTDVSGDLRRARAVCREAGDDVDHFFRHGQPGGQVAGVPGDPGGLDGTGERQAGGLDRLDPPDPVDAVSAFDLAGGVGDRVGIGEPLLDRGEQPRGKVGLRRGVKTGLGPFPQASSRTGRAAFTASGSPVVLLRVRPVMDLGVAAGADDQGFPSLRSHRLDPVGCGRGVVPVEIDESLDVVDRDAVG